MEWSHRSIEPSQVISSRVINHRPQSVEKSLAIRSGRFAKLEPGNKAYSSQPQLAVLTNSESSLEVALARIFRPRIYARRSFMPPLTLTLPPSSSPYITGLQTPVEVGEEFES